MIAARFRTWSPWAAMLGGVLWIVLSVAWALLPEGCIRSECDQPGRSMRDAQALLPLMVAALVLLIAGIAGLVMRVQAEGKLGGLGRLGVVALVAGLAVLVTGSMLAALDLMSENLMPVFVVPGGFLTVGGLVLLALAVLRAAILPRWAVGLLVVGALSLVVSNEQNWRVLFWAPCGAAWAAVGAVLWSQARRAASDGTGQGS